MKHEIETIKGQKSAGVWVHRGQGTMHHTNQLCRFQNASSLAWVCSLDEGMSQPCKHAHLRISQSYQRSMVQASTCS